MHNGHKYLLLFFKYYDAREKRLRYVMQTVLHKSSMLVDVMDQVRTTLNLTCRNISIATFMDVAIHHEDQPMDPVPSSTPASHCELCQAERTQAA